MGSQNSQNNLMIECLMFMRLCHKQHHHGNMCENKIYCTLYRWKPLIVLGLINLQYITSFWMFYYNPNGRIYIGDIFEYFEGVEQFCYITGIAYVINPMLFFIIIEWRKNLDPQLSWLEVFDILIGKEVKSPLSGFYHQKIIDQYKILSLRLFQFAKYFPKIEALIAYTIMALLAYFPLIP